MFIPYTGDQLMTDFVVSVGSSLDNLTDCGDTYIDTAPAGRTVTIPCDLSGRYVHYRRVQGGYRSDRAYLCEVEVFDSPSGGEWSELNVILS